MVVVQYLKPPPFRGEYVCTFGYVGMNCTAVTLAVCDNEVWVVVRDLDPRIKQYRFLRFDAVRWTPLPQWATGYIGYASLHSIHVAADVVLLVYDDIVSLWQRTPPVCMWKRYIQNDGGLYATWNADAREAWIVEEENRHTVFHRVDCDGNSVVVMSLPHTMLPFEVSFLHCHNNDVFLGERRWSSKHFPGNFLWPAEQRYESGYESGYDCTDASTSDDYVALTREVRWDFHEVSVYERTEGRLLWRLDRDTIERVLATDYRSFCPTKIAWTSSGELLMLETIVGVIHAFH